MKMIMIAMAATLALTVAAQAAGPNRVQSFLTSLGHGKVVFTR